MGLKVLPGPLMSERTTLKLGGPALAEVHIGHERDLDELPAVLEKAGGRPMVLGWGSNILASDDTLPIVLLRVPEGGGPRIVHETGERVTVQADAGMRLPRLLTWCAKQGLSGLEGLVGIPGSVGGAVAMNAGSFGCEMAEVLSRVLLFSPCCGLRWVGREDVRMDYRFFAPRTYDDYFIVMGVELDVIRAEKPLVDEVMARHMTTKKASQPISAASAGCVFKNPEGDAAGRLLEQAGFRGKGLGGMIFSEIHANFLVNAGGGTSEQAFELIASARDEVTRRFGVGLELEVKVVS
ncbi:UDP-N-acetylmuramate dehydrogenase [Desulfovibrio ferrophilus]|uniref:UDP-N-acetylenolpyruvoylglucosamine reductase n=1 Tax=Desulfovibrio ferrophilus TaxID=241368 RepID=A0A2Z6AZ65_9BACT|nr:UDP-N-acetylmuramate dehydrogenase [Desulfovibrio ferrophilus]BBD08542.1 UDP-N-acetylenolpyruvoylglucosamine reductase [Desulfovibrio ferrophilus]